MALTGPSRCPGRLQLVIHKFDPQEEQGINSATVEVQAVARLSEIPRLVETSTEWVFSRDCELYDIQNKKLKINFEQASELGAIEGHLLGSCSTIHVYHKNDLHRPQPQDILPNVEAFEKWVAGLEPDDALYENVDNFVGSYRDGSKFPGPHKVEVSAKLVPTADGQEEWVLTITAYGAAMSQEELKLAFQTAGTSFDQLRDSFFMNGNGDAGFNGIPTLLGLIGSYAFGRWGLGKLASGVLADCKTIYTHEAGNPLVDYMTQDKDNIKETGNINAIADEGRRAVEPELLHTSYTRQVLSKLKPAVLHHFEDKVRRTQYMRDLALQLGSLYFWHIVGIPSFMQPWLPAVLIEKLPDSAAQLRLEVGLAGQDPHVIEAADPPALVDPRDEWPLVWQTRQGQLLLDLRECIAKGCLPLVLLFQMDWQQERKLKGLPKWSGGPITSEAAAQSLQEKGQKVIPDYQYALAVFSYSPTNADGEAPLGQPVITEQPGNTDMAAAVEETAYTAPSACSSHSPRREHGPDETTGAATPAELKRQGRHQRFVIWQGREMPQSLTGNKNGMNLSCLTREKNTAGDLLAQADCFSRVVGFLFMDWACLPEVHKRHMNWSDSASWALSLPRVDDKYGIVKECLKYMIMDAQTHTLSEWKCYDEIFNDVPNHMRLNWLPKDVHGSLEDLLEPPPGVDESAGEQRGQTLELAGVGTGSLTVFRTGDLVEFEPEEGLGEEGACGKKKGYGYMTVAIKKPSGTITLMVQSWTADGFQAPSDATEKWSGRVGGSRTIQVPLHKVQRAHRSSAQVDQKLLRFVKAVLPNNSYKATADVEHLRLPEVFDVTTKPESVELSLVVTKADGKVQHGPQSECLRLLQNIKIRTELLDLSDKQPGRVVHRHMISPRTGDFKADVKVSHCLPDSGLIPHHEYQLSFLVVPGGRLTESFSSKPQMIYRFKSVRLQPQKLKLRLTPGPNSVSGQAVRIGSDVSIQLELLTSGNTSITTSASTLSSEAGVSNQGTAAPPEVTKDQVLTSLSAEDQALLWKGLELQLWHPTSGSQLQLGKLPHFRTWEIREGRVVIKGLEIPAQKLPDSKSDAIGVCEAELGAELRLPGDSGEATPVDTEGTVGYSLLSQPLQHCKLFFNSPYYNEGRSNIVSSGQVLAGGSVVVKDEQGNIYSVGPWGVAPNEAPKLWVSLEGLQAGDGSSGFTIPFNSNLLELPHLKVVAKRSEPVKLQLQLLEGSSDHVVIVSCWSVEDAHLPDDALPVLRFAIVQSGATSAGSSSQQPTVIDTVTMAWQVRTSQLLLNRKALTKVDYNIWPSDGSSDSSPTQFKTLKDLVNYQDYAQVISANTGVFVIMPSGQVLHSPPQVNDAYQGLFQQVSDAFEALIIHQSQILALRLPPDDSTLPSSCELKLMAYGSSKQDGPDKQLNSKLRFRVNDKLQPEAVDVVDGLSVLSAADINHLFEDSGNYLTSSEGHLPTLTMTFYDPKDEAMQYKFFVRHELSLRSLRVLGIFEDPSIAGDEPTDEDDDAVRTRLTEHLSAGHHLQPIQAQVHAGVWVAMCVEGLASPTGPPVEVPKNTSLQLSCTDDQGADVPVEVLSLRWPSNKKEEANKMSTRTTSNQPVLKDYSCIAWVRFEAKHDVVTASMKLTTNGAASSSTSSAVVSAQLDRAVQVLPGVADCVNVVAGKPQTGAGLDQPLQKVDVVAGTAAKVHLQLLERVLPHRTSRDCVAESGRFNIEWPGELAAADLPKFVMFKQGKGTLSFQPGKDQSWLTISQSGLIIQEKDINVILTPVEDGPFVHMSPQSLVLRCMPGAYPSSVTPVAPYSWNNEYTLEDSEHGCKLPTMFLAGYTASGDPLPQSNRSLKASVRLRKLIRSATEISGDTAHDGTQSAAAGALDDSAPAVAGSESLAAVSDGAAAADGGESNDSDHVGESDVYEDTDLVLEGRVVTSLAALELPVQIPAEATSIVNHSAFFVVFDGLDMPREAGSYSVYGIEVAGEHLPLQLFFLVKAGPAHQMLATPAGAEQVHVLDKSKPDAAGQHPHYTLRIADRSGNLAEAESEVFDVELWLKPESTAAPAAPGAASTSASAAATASTALAASFQSTEPGAVTGSHRLAVQQGVVGEVSFQPAPWPLSRLVERFTYNLIAVAHRSTRNQAGPSSGQSMPLSDEGDLVCQLEKVLVASAGEHGLLTRKAHIEQKLNELQAEHGQLTAAKNAATKAVKENDTEIEKLSQQEAQHPWRNTVESGLAAAREAIIQFAGLQQQPGAEMEAAQVCAHNWHTLPLSVPAGVATYLPSCLEEGSSAGVLGLLQSLGSVECLDCNKALSLYAGSTLLGFPGAAMVVVTNQEAAERVRQAHQQAGVNNSPLVVIDISKHKKWFLPSQAGSTGAGSSGAAAAPAVGQQQKLIPVPKVLQVLLASMPDEAKEGFVGWGPNLLRLSTHQLGLEVSYQDNKGAVMTGNLRETLFSYLFGKLLVFKTSESMEAYASFISKPSTAAKFKKKRFPASDRGWLVGMDLIVAAAPASFEAESSSAAAAAGGASVTWAAGGNLLQGVDIRNVCSMFGAVSEEELTSVGALDNQLLGLQNVYMKLSSSQQSYTVLRERLENLRTTTHGTLAAELSTTTQALTDFETDPRLWGRKPHLEAELNRVLDELEAVRKANRPAGAASSQATAPGAADMEVHAHSGDVCMEVGAAAQTDKVTSHRGISDRGGRRQNSRTRARAGAAAVGRSSKSRKVTAHTSPGEAGGANTRNSKRKQQQPQAAAPPARSSKRLRG